MTLDDRLSLIENKLDMIVDIWSIVPEWLPLSIDMANQLGYKSLQGLRAKALNNLEPKRQIKQVGKRWYIHKGSLCLLKK
jgi:hypothetical protein